MTSDYRVPFAAIIVCFSVAFALLIVGLANPHCLGLSGTAEPAASTRPATVVRTTSTQAPAGSAFRVVGRDTAFDKASLQAEAGALTIEFANQDAGVRHNFHLFNGSDPSGESVAMTAITSGPDTQTLVIVISEGAYVYQCDVHPAQMMGNLTVSEGSTSAR